MAPVTSAPLGRMEAARFLCSEWKGVSKFWRSMSYRVGEACWLDKRFVHGRDGL